MKKPLKKKWQVDMKTGIRIRVILLLAFLLASCTPVPTENPVLETAVALMFTANAETQVAIPTVTLPVQPPTTISRTIPEATLTPLVSDEDAFWKNTDPMPSNISITEYAIPTEKDPTKNDGLFQFVPTQAWTVGKPNISPTPRKITLKEIGYEFRTGYTEKGLSYRQLFRDGRILFEYVTYISDVYIIPTDSGQITAFYVEIKLGNQNYLIENDIINAWGGYAIWQSEPVLYKGKLLWARTFSDHTEIRESNGNIIFSFPTDWFHRPKFREWNGHWILEANDTVIQDGEILNEKLGFQEIFNWGLVQDKPTYFFRKGSRVGISHNGQILPIQYQDVAHGLCCSPAQNNPSMGSNAIHFYGKRNNVWYYVAMEFK